jgi:hypothetical protein
LSSISQPTQAQDDLVRGEALWSEGKDQGLRFHQRGLRCQNKNAEYRFWFARKTNFRNISSKERRNAPQTRLYSDLTSVTGARLHRADQRRAEHGEEPRQGPLSKKNACRARGSEEPRKSISIKIKNEKRGTFPLLAG